ncbi:MULTISPECIES: 3-oxoacyl-ACP synthase [Spirosoma]|uniref:3-oxoacyl-ACP synthase n=1 Tax=Spirosoma liriopis TaxID=2937440 RepID=A0ABT0HGC4_9BACT|nr:3-oxoacyl-ACP synthase [Spirosoma oryzicola]MCK8491190.1 3-oxoacyl-ACP synthase [Spirosoma liriopis]UHG90565.1 3-oxoacyl-ACP synthase [Spirosoma oryzicola]
MNSIEIKQALVEQCRAHVQQRIETARQAMEAAQESANSESKSSAGDKYETGRAMAQLERDRYAQQLDGALTLEQELARINSEKEYSTVQPGSLVTTNRGTFFISISAGKLRVDNKDIFAVSPASPVGVALAGRRAGEEVTFNKMVYTIVSVA